ncbi:unnamed protein product [Caenorhabditis sp. 36 PRJEB53466]|nr:unnamed protein product [Caenorhabditis sp. 36 PRJEB53466]
MPSFVFSLFLVFVSHIYADNCIDKFCPPGTFCDERPGPCVKPPCRTILACLPVEANGCARMECKSPQVCVERVRPCIGRACKEIATCETPNTCAAVVCPPSQKCKLENGKPTCKKHIPPTRGIIGKAVLDEKQFKNDE